MRFWLCGPLVLSGLITGFALCGVANSKAGQLPKFSQFPAREYNRGPTGRVDLSDPHAYSYRTRLREGAQQGANFAGHYRVVTWGCGTECETGAIIDAFTGHVVFLPSVNSYHMEHEMDPDFNSFVFRLDSRLIVFAGQLNDQGEKATFFMDFDGKTFRQVYQVIDKGGAEQPLAVEGPSSPKVQAPSGPNTPAQSSPGVQTPNERMNTLDDAPQTIAAASVMTNCRLKKDTNIRYCTPPAAAQTSTHSDSASIVLAPPPRYLGSADLSRIHSTYDSNQARFFRDFAGKRFLSSLPIVNIVENPIFRGRYSVYFGNNGLLGDVRCEFSNKSDIADIAEVNKGDIVSVSGIVEDHTFGAIDLTSCQVIEPIDLYGVSPDAIGSMRR
jgi:hypothetical protein